MAIGQTLKGYLFAMIATLFGVSLVPAVADAVSTAQENVSGASSIMIGLISLIFAAGVLYKAATHFFQ